MAEYIEREALLKDIGETVLFSVRGGAELPTPEMRGANKVIDRIKSTPTADVVDVDKVAELLCLSFGGDTCACNFNGNDEWLWEKCKYSETECPFPEDELGCWKEYVKAMLAKMDGKGDTQ